MDSAVGANGWYEQRVRSDETMFWSLNVVKEDAMYSSSSPLQVQMFYLNGRELQPILILKAVLRDTCSIQQSSSIIRRARGQENGPERATVALSMPTSTMSTAQKVKLDSIARLE
ncbi:hypothetical protein J1614_011866 [Plenodomus biglobosus]|nr:hypothetical protein J1614_011866 [Plenodomus biglobosus]